VLSVAYDSSIVFTATPDSGYGIDTIRIDGSPLDSAVSPFTLSAIASDHSVGVTFRRLGTVTVVISLKSHWNLVSLPLLVDDPSAASLFPSAQTKAFGYDQAYQIAETLSAGRGYWMEFGHDLQVSQTGDPEGEDSIGVAAGWNLIGSITAAVPVSSIGADPPGLVVSRFFGYAGGYVAADTIVPGLGYWVKASQGGTLYLSSNPSPRASGRVRVVPTAARPPAPRLPAARVRRF
jgi:hypothetical protein